MFSITRIARNVNHKSKWLASSLLIAAALVFFAPATTIAAPYSEGTYGSGLYSADSGDPSTAASSTSSGSLANTGQSVMLIASGAALAIGIGGLILAVRRRRNRK